MANATRMVESGSYLWNAGIFLFAVKGILDGFKEHAPDMLAPCQQSVTEAKPDLGFLRLAPEPWAALDDISIDYAVMEQTKSAVVIPMDVGWSDVGSWSSLWEVSEKDEEGNEHSG